MRSTLTQLHKLDRKHQLAHSFKERQLHSQNRKTSRKIQHVINSRPTFLYLLLAILKYLLLKNVLFHSVISLLIWLLFVTFVKLNKVVSDSNFHQHFTNWQIRTVGGINSIHIWWERTSFKQPNMYCTRKHMRQSTHWNMSQRYDLTFKII